MNIYDVNKQIIAQLGVLTEEEYDKAKQLLTEYVLDTHNTYYMLLCKDVDYYTLFYVYYGMVRPNNLNKFNEDVIDCIHDIGAIKSVEKVDGAIEIWAHPVYGDPVVLYLFPYDMGVVECDL
jgi:hypothetical protein